MNNNNTGVSLEESELWRRADSGQGCCARLPLNFVAPGHGWHIKQRLLAESSSGCSGDGFNLAPRWRKDRLSQKSGGGMKGRRPDTSNSQSMAQHVRQKTRCNTTERSTLSLHIHPPMDGWVVAFNSEGGEVGRSEGRGGWGKNNKRGLNYLDFPGRRDTSWRTPTSCFKSKQILLLNQYKLRYF